MWGGRREKHDVTATERDLVLLHVAFAFVATLVVLVPAGPLGWRIAGLLLAYDAAVLALGRFRRDRELLRLWVFAAVLSIWQVLPDVFLVQGLDVLVFPDDGFPDIGPVTGTMAALWTVPVVAVVAAGTAAERRRGGRVGNLVAAGVAFIVFVLGEATLTAAGLWEARNVSSTAGVATYIIPAEVLLGVVALRGFHALNFRHPLVVLPVTLLVTVIYTGAAALSWLFLG